MTLVKSVETWDAFPQAWSGLQNFWVGGDVFPYRFSFPPLDTLIDVVRRDEKARILAGRPGDRFDGTDVAAQFRALPIEDAVRAPVQMSHFALERFTAPGQILAGLDQVVQRWQTALAEQGFTWTRIYPILFLSGPFCHTNYHIDRSHVLAWQISGQKRFCWLKDPERWCPAEVRRQLGNPDGIVRPEGLTADDTIEATMQPGDTLMNVPLTPHWVYATAETAYSINVAHWDLRLHGQLCPMGREVEAIMKEKR